MQWTDIKSCIFAACQTAFQENNLGINNDKLETDISIFVNLIQFQSGYAFWDGTRAEFPRVLEKACISNMGQLESLKSLSGLFDVLAKKTLVLSGAASYREVDRLMMNDLIKKTNIIPNYHLEKEHVENYLGCPSYICFTAHNTRNVVHESPSWDAAEVLRRQRYVLAFYIWIIDKYREDLIRQHPELCANLVPSIVEDKEAHIYYDYVTYSESTHNMRQKLLEAFILHTLFSQSLVKKDLIKAIVEFSKSTIAESVAKRNIEKMLTLAQKIHMLENGTIELTEEGLNYVTKVNNDFNVDYSAFIQSIQTILNSLSISIRVNDFIEFFKAFLEQNITLNFEDLSEDSDILEKNRAYNKLCGQLNDLGVDNEKSHTLIQEALILCAQNDIIYRLCLGKIANKSIDKSQFPSEMIEQRRVTYFDTQILLYFMCLSEDFADWKENVWYQMAKNIIQHPNKSRYVFKTFRPYVSEVAYQLTQALSLLSIVDYTEKKNIKISNNIFYNHYYYLASNEGLPDSVNTYEEYLQAMFSLSSDDLGSSNLLSIAEGVVYTKLSESFNLEIDDVAYMSTNDISKVGDIFDKIAVEHKLAPKVGKLRENDIFVLLSLFKNQDINNAFSFITWDQTFAPARSLYRATYKRTSENPFFYVYSPGKFLGHLDYLNLRVDSENLSNELLALMNESKSSQKTIIEKYNALLAKYDTPTGERKKYLRTIQSVLAYSDDDFTALFDENEKNQQQGRDMLHSFDEILIETKRKGAEEIYVALFKNEDTFKQLISRVQEYVTSQSSIDSIEKLTEEILKIQIHN